MKLSLFSRRTAAVAGIAAALLLGGCDLLDVENPGAITEPELLNPERIPLIVNGAVGEFQPAFTWYSHYVGTFTDELTDVHTWRENRPIDLRQVDEFNGLLATTYTRLQRSRAAGDIAAERIREVLGDEAEQHPGVARSLAYAGYSMVLLAESYCSAPIDVSAAYQPDELFAMAIERFDEAIRVANAARSAGHAASGDTLAALANLGAARASLNRGDMQSAIAYASQVPADFEFWAAYSDNSSRQYNEFWNATRETNAYLIPGPDFLQMDDDRIPMKASVPGEMLGSFDGYIPLRPYSFRGWSPDESTKVERDTDVRFASGLEARYIIAEAGGMSDAELRAFINERRAVGGQEPYQGNDLMAELRDQRRRDLYLTGHRLGDLRRYMNQGVGDFFPTGTWPHSDQTYGTDTCWPIPLSELNSNPNL